MLNDTQFKADNFFFNMKTQIHYRLPYKIQNIGSNIHNIKTKLEQNNYLQNKLKKDLA